MCDDGDAHARHRRRQHRTAVDRRRPRRGREFTAVGDRRLHPRPGHSRPRCRVVGRSPRPPPSVRRRPRLVHGRLAAVRPRPDDLVPRSRPGRAGHRWGGPVRLLARPPRRRLRPGAGTGVGPGRLRRDHRRRLRGRPARRRSAHRTARLARDLLRQRADRPRDPAPVPALGARIAGSPPARRRCAGAVPGRGGTGGARVRRAARPRDRVVRCPAGARVRRRCRCPRRLRRARDAHRRTDVAATSARQPGLRRSAGRGLRHLGVVVRGVRLHHPVPAERPAVVAGAGGVGVPARDRRHVRRRRYDGETRSCRPRVGLVVVLAGARRRRVAHS